MTNETKKEIYEAYINGEKVTDIAKKHDMWAADVSRIAISMGAQPRRTLKPRERKEEIIKTCPKCHRKIALKDAKFCCYCGADMRTEKDRLIERIRKGMELISLLPSEARDEVQQLLIDVEKELRKGE